VRWRPARRRRGGELALTVGGGVLALAGGRDRPGLRALPVRVVLARLDTRVLRFRLAAAADGAGHAGPWTVDRAPADAAGGAQRRPVHRRRPLGVDRARRARTAGRRAAAPSPARSSSTPPPGRVVGADSGGGVLSAAWRAGDRRVALALQSYPTLLDGRRRGADGAPHDHRGAIDRGHRDAPPRRRRAARRAAPRRPHPLRRPPRHRRGAAAARLPVGLTVPEAAALLGALGARRAVLLDGGLSAQLLVRRAAGAPARWPGLRAVPLGLVAAAR
jgi:hypothetical protein